jgi:hypothetical protein
MQIQREEILKMREIQCLLRFAVRAGLVVVALCGLMLGTTPKAFASTIQVPQDYPTIQLAVNAATAGDMVRVGPGQWCGARVTKQLDLEAEGGATIIGCPDGTPGPSSLGGGLFRIGFRLNAVAASGTTIRHFTFDGRGWTFGNPTPLAIGVFVPNGVSPSADNVIVEHNQFLGGLLGMESGGNGGSINHNVFDGFTVDPVTGVGGAAIALANLASPATNNTASFNKIATTVPAGTFPSFIAQINIPFLGVLGLAEDNMLLTNNTISIALGPGAAAGTFTAGIVVSDLGPGFTSMNSVIVNNDGRGSSYSVVITLDSGGGTGNTVNTTIRGNFGNNSINMLTTDVTNRSIHTLLQCDSSGRCP